VASTLLAGPVFAAVVASHPRLLLTVADKQRLAARVAANDAAWQALKARADELTGDSILPYEYASRTSEPDDTIFYDYQGSGWYDAAMPLALAYQMTGDHRYSDKLLALADEMLRAQADPANNPPNGRPPLEPDDYYPTRYLGPVAATIFDWCYDQLGSARKAQLVALMNAYFDDMRANAYQRNDSADGNYFGGHLAAAAAMGYASWGDNPRAQEMIDWARIRIDGTPGAVSPSDVPSSYFAQVFDGGYLSAGAAGYNAPPGITGAPFASGFDFQGWAYGSGDYQRLIDAMLMIRSASGEDLFAAHPTWFPAVLRAEWHALLPDRFEVDPSGDWGGYQGAVIPRGVPARLAYLLAGTADGPMAQELAVNRIADSTIPGVTVWPLSEWEDFLFSDPSRPSAAPDEPPYYSAFAPAYPQGGGGDGALPYFIMRSDWGPTALWASVHMGSAWYDDHQHKDGGTVIVKRGADWLLVNASDWKGDAGGPGLLGDSSESFCTSAANTLYFDDFGDYMYPNWEYDGGGGFWGFDQVVADEQDGDRTYVRSDLSTGYDRSSDVTDVGNRRLASFYRSFLYLRAAGAFVLFDQVGAKPSTNPRGPYRKQLRWHLPNLPTIAGTRAWVDQGASRLTIDALLPADAVLAAVDESRNPDPCYPAAPQPCTPYGDDSGTWRVEVSSAANPDAVRFLTLLRPGPAGVAPVAATPIASDDGAMVGASFPAGDGTAEVVLLNAGAGQVPSPPTRVSVPAAAIGGNRYTFCGMAPGARYAAVFSGSRLVLERDDPGPFTASPAGVVSFRGLAVPTETHEPRRHLRRAGAP